MIEPQIIQLRVLYFFFNSIAPFLIWKESVCNCCALDEVSSINSPLCHVNGIDQYLMYLCHFVNHHVKFFFGILSLLLDHAKFVIFRIGMEPLSF
jgi:hypothetical protein